MRTPTLNEALEEEARQLRIKKREDDAKGMAPVLRGLRKEDLKGLERHWRPSIIQGLPPGPPERA